MYKYISLIALLGLLWSCANENTAKSGENSNQNDKNKSSKASAKIDAPCELIPIDQLKAALNITELEVSSQTNKDEKNKIYDCTYEWEDGKRYGDFTIGYDASDQRGYPSEEKALAALERAVAVLKKGISAKSEIKDKEAEKLAEGKNSNQDGNLDLTLKMNFGRIDEEVGFPAAWKAADPKAMLALHQLMFVKGGYMFTITMSFNKASEVDVASAKKYAIAAAKALSL